ncbi:iron permease [Actinomadura darangshiensis]|uniref:Iron permease n=1 Tax=Actinomadura darangshiensis TaxID=705336 RepID=A0A4V2YXQ3_9ACTN|nr:iron uptake transporter permease EfeU [Actinomadura darangshiensis]TDD89617.1 iron permease [Actinomadura darangshiensis]
MHFSWALAFPNLLIGLREGLEAGLIVSILVATVRRLAPERSLTGVWLGVAAAAATSLSAGAVLTFAEASLPGTAQEGFAGGLSLLAVALVTFMVFWMRRAARSISGELKEKVGSALTMGGLALTVTAFVAVAREGLETALFIWTNTQAAGSNPAPLTGAAIGLAIAVALCAGMYKRVLKLNLGKVFTSTGAVLIVIAGGVLAYGIRDLQEAGLVPGRDSSAYDVSAHISAGAWWMEIVRGLTNITVQMTWAQVIAYVGFIGVVMSLFLRRSRPPAAREARPAPEAAGTGGEARGRNRRPVIAAAAVTLVPAVVAGAVVLTGRKSGGAQRIELSPAACAGDWTPPSAGRVRFSISNPTRRPVDIELIQESSRAIAAEIEMLAPGTTRDLPVSLAPGRYAWRCAFDGGRTTVSAAAAVTGSGGGGEVRLPVTEADMAPVLAGYRGHVADGLGELDERVAELRSDLADGDLGAARSDWLTAHQAYHRLGAAYGAFGDAGDAIDGLASGLPGGVRDKGFTGFHKIEYGLWHGRDAAETERAAAALASAVAGLRDGAAGLELDPADVATRAHEILEDTLRFELTGQDDYGSHSAKATATADIEGDRAVLRFLTPLIEARAPGLTARCTAALDDFQNALDTVLDGHRHKAVQELPLAVRQRVNAKAGRAAETLAPIPDLLEIQR